MICASIKEHTQEKVIEKLQNVPADYDLVEIWINEIEKVEIDKIVEESAFPLLYKITNTSNEDLIHSILDSDAAYIDLDMQTDQSLIDRVKEYKKQTKLIISHHDFERTPGYEDVVVITENIKAMGADLGKIVLKAKKPEDSLIPIKALTNITFPLVCFCMGEHGKLSRIFASQFGSLIDFVPPDKSWVTAEGQIVFSEWQKLKKL